MSVELARLDLGDRLGDGGQAEVFLVNNRPGQAFKRYRDSVLPNLRVDVLEELAAETGQLAIEGRPITYWATWPTETVRAGGRVVGFLMPLLDPVFSLREGKLKGKHASFSYLATAPAPFWGHVRLPSQGDRVKLLASLAGVMQQLHHRRMVVGDLSWGNVLWARSPELRVILLDCDGIRPPRGLPVSKQLDSPDWQDPLAAAVLAPDADRDCYKLSLMVLRVLTQELNARPSLQGGHRLPGLAPETEAAIDGLLVRSASPPGDRPTATEWRQALQGRSVQQVVAPSTTSRPGLAWPDGQARPAGSVANREYRSVVPPSTRPAQPAPLPAEPSQAERRWRPVSSAEDRS